ncbi:hypothetical protein GCM10010168_85910 [Actinoplanes ianthinogenes]|uniref:Bacteriophage Mu GpT domain-containing protein n=1 Tax=Actinoplanes ianthinogenes TaxID=122358 RepID=A0ABM7M128_9ACTN|nr:hypothetical protein Aiant_59790 [Actinoplanes ianthinogenes]GGR53769.1 hypothetical protein GCM10010168_85910 [Actinoplanes ianthinogenes]
MPANGKVTPELLAKLVAMKAPKAKVAPARHSSTRHAAPSRKSSSGGNKAVKAALAGTTSKARAAVRKNEAIDGVRSARDTRGILQAAVNERARTLAGNRWAWADVCDYTDDLVVYEHDGKTWQAPYTLTEAGTAGTAELGEPTEVVAQVWYVPAADAEDDAPGIDDPNPELAEEDQVAESVDEPETEELDRIDGRVIEAAGTDAAGGRIFRVRIISAGDSKNGRRYPANVLESAASLYEGAKAYDHHRTMEELRSGTISGLIGYYRNVEAASDGLDGDLCLLPSATHTAEALDATIAAQEQGLPPLVGISHDAMTVLRPISVGGRRMQEAVSITKVNSADVVSDPAAGGKATRVLAGGIEIEESKESDVAVNAADVLAALKTATPEDLAAVGLQRSSETTTPPEPEGMQKTSFLGGLMIQQKVSGAGLPAQVVESLTEALPDRITESDVDAQIASLKTAMGMAERAGLAPTATTQVTQESFDKKKAALDAFFAGDFSNGYRSFKQAYLDVTGYRQASWDEDLNRRIMRESIGNLYDSGDRSTESLTSASWNLVLGDSITRRLVAQYAHPSLQTWRQIVSSVIPVSDFRTQRIDRVGGYGTLPVVNQGAPYQPLTSPGNEEVTYALTKRGGTEDLTMEMIANDDVRAISNIPNKLGLAAARTLHNFVWDFILNNPTVYDGVALFHASHNNTTAVALGQSTLSQLRAKMRDQTAYGDTSDILSLVPKFLIVPNELEELAFQLTTSAVAIPSTPAGASNTPNLHQGMTPIVVDYDTDPNDWFVVADPSMCPTIEVGFYQGRETPELFTQSDPSVGSMFNSDTLTYKIRHIYSGAVLDFRGFQRATQ